MQKRTDYYIGLIETHGAAKVIDHLLCVIEQERCETKLARERVKQISNERRAALRQAGKAK